MQARYRLEQAALSLGKKRRILASAAIAANLPTDANGKSSTRHAVASD
jgi:hypothetical protein